MRAQSNYVESTGEPSTELATPTIGAPKGEVLRSHPADISALFAVAEDHFSMGDDVEGIRILRQAIYADPGFLKGYDRLSEAYAEMGRGREAAEIIHEWARHLMKRLPPAPRWSDALQDRETLCTVEESVARYYSIRAPEYDRTASYMRERSDAFMTAIKEQYQSALTGRDVLEIACGTGYWTIAVAQAARTVLATDRNESVINIVREKTSALPNVRCQVADAYSLEGVDGPFAGAFAQFWWSHIPRSRIREFLTSLHLKLRPGAVVMFMDSMPYPRGGASLRLDENGDVLEGRILTNGDQYEVLKNFPIEAEVREALMDFADNVVYFQNDDVPLWTVRYTAKQLSDG